MELNDLLAPEAIVPLLKASSKKQVIQELSERAAKLTGLPQRQIFEKLLQRERLGSTGVGQGVAIPHGKLEELEKIYGIFALLDKPVNFDANGRQACRYRLSVAGSRRRRRRSSQGAGSHCPRIAQ